MVKIPQLEIAEKIRIFVRKALVRFIRLLLFFQWAFARVLYFQGRRDDQNLAQAIFFLSCPDDPGDPRVDRQPSQLSPHFGQRVILRDRPQFEQRLVAVFDRFRFRWFQKRKILNLTQAECLRL